MRASGILPIDKEARLEKGVQKASGPRCRGRWRWHGAQNCVANHRNRNSAGDCAAGHGEQSGAQPRFRRIC